MKIAYREALQAAQGNLCPRRRVIPPNRLEARNWDLLAALAHLPGADPRVILRESLGRLLNREQIYFAPSARSAIARVLRLLPQTEVVMPAFNCGVVKSAVEVAGKRIIYVDIAQGGVNATAEEFAAVAQPGRILLITYQFGVPTDVEAICELARSRGCVTIEDAACSFGAMRSGQRLGTFADFGVFSFESWKRLPAFRGGVIVVNNKKIFDPTALDQDPISQRSLRMPMRELLSAMGRNIATIPWLYGSLILPVLLRGYFKPVTNSTAPEVQVDVTTTSPFTREFHPYQAQLISRMLGRMDRIRRHISDLVSIYTEEFRGSPVSVLLPSERDDAGLLRFPIAFPGKSRAAVLREGLKRGLYLETEFENPLPEPGEQSRYPNSVWAGQNLILLPLYTALSLKDARWLAAQVREIATAVH